MLFVHFWRVRRLIYQADAELWENLSRPPQALQESILSLHMIPSGTVSGNVCPRVLAKQLVAV